jgi:hypothetical protein
MIAKSEKDLAQNKVAEQFAAWQVEAETDEAKKKEKTEELMKITAQVELIEMSIAKFKDFLPNLK